MCRKLYLPVDETLPAAPMLVLSDQRRADVIIGLRGLGWGRISDLPSTAPGTVALTDTELRVDARGAVMVRERTPTQPAPTGWCEAVTALSGRCLVIILPEATFNSDNHLTDTLREVLHADTVAAALIPLSITTD